MMDDHDTSEAVGGCEAMRRATPCPAQPRAPRRRRRCWAPAAVALVLCLRLVDGGDSEEGRLRALLSSFTRAAGQPSVLQRNHPHPPETPEAVQPRSEAAERAHTSSGRWVHQSHASSQSAAQSRSRPRPTAVQRPSPTTELPLVESKTRSHREHGAGLPAANADSVRVLVPPTARAGDLMQVEVPALGQSPAEALAGASLFHQVQAALPCCESCALLTRVSCNLACVGWIELLLMAIFPIICAV